MNTFKTYIKKALQIIPLLIIGLYFSQEKYKPNWEKGIIGGINLSYYSQNIDFCSVGFNLGGYAVYKFKPKMGIETGLNYTFKNNNISMTYYVIINDILTEVYGIRPKATMGSLDIPILFQYDLLPKLYIKGGPKISFLLHSKLNERYYDVTFPEKIFSKVQLYGNLGVGYRFNDKLTFDLVYENGFNYSIPDAELRNFAFSLMLKYKL